MNPLGHPAQITSVTRRVKIAFLALIAAVIAIYGSHLDSEFHFDDFHTIVQNPWIRDLRNLPRFFTDAGTSSVLPANQVFRPTLITSLAVDYRLAGGLQPVIFHASTLFWFLVCLTLFFLLCRDIFHKMQPAAAKTTDWMALFATALFALHPAIAETVNYVIQRAEIYSTLGVVAGLVIYISLPRQRRYYLYLLPVILGILSKPPALVFPCLLFLYIWLIEEESPKTALSRSIPAIVTAVALGILTLRMTPHSFKPGAASRYTYLITQPAVIFRYFRTFFIPTGLTADSGRLPFTGILQYRAIAGFAFLLALAWLAIWTARRRETRTIAFGLFWFLIALLPTSLFPLAEVENDHRMFFPFAGLAVAAVSAVALWFAAKPLPRTAAVSICSLILAGCAIGAWQRCEVWRTGESLWLDVTIKNPHNARGLTNYGLALMGRGDYESALTYFQRAQALSRDYGTLEANLGIVYGKLHYAADAERHFLKAIQLMPGEANPKYLYARWLQEAGRFPQAAEPLQAAIQQNAAYADAYYLLMQLYAEQSDGDNLGEVARRMLARFPSDQVAAQWLARAPQMHPTAETYMNNSTTYYRTGDYAHCIEAAHKALTLQPGNADAWNNIGAAFNAMRQWDDGIHAEQEAIRLRPDFQLARRNLEWAQQHKASAQHN